VGDPYAAVVLRNQKRMTDAQSRFRAEILDALPKADRALTAADLNVIRPKLDAIFRRWYDGPDALWLLEILAGARDARMTAVDAVAKETRDATGLT
jgi:hypothetical protein